MYLAKEGIQVVNNRCKESQHHAITELQVKMMTA